MEITEALLRDDVRTLLKISLAALFAVWVGIRYYRVIKADEDAEIKVLAGYASFPVREYEDMEEDERLLTQRRAEALNWFDEGYTADEETRKTA